METFLFILYIAIFIFLIVDFVLCIKGKVKWLWLFVVEIISSALAAGLTIYYNGLEGYGCRPGLTYLGEILCSFGALILYGIMFVATLITKLVLYYKRKNKQKVH